ncbi:hypothetical protein [uncultured Rhodoferax sp.]|uniref:hypothetical protein n=1 Tax=uncultured Rhodoferax sp. TaxID=223188 RepID=UPI0025CE533E|nr:hypothetical protein [uncultured Rhodoferax sp.]
MSEQLKRQLRQESLLQTATALCAARDNLMRCADLLREHLFNADLVGRQRAIQLADEVVTKAKNNAPPAAKNLT